MFFIFLQIYEPSVTPLDGPPHLPSCSNCKRVLNDFCKKDPRCIGNDCEIDKTCSKDIQYSCQTNDFDCNPETCRDWYEMHKDPFWECNKKPESSNDLILKSMIVVIITILRYLIPITILFFYFRYIQSSTSSKKL